MFFFRFSFSHLFWRFLRGKIFFVFGGVIFCDFQVASPSLKGAFDLAGGFVAFALVVFVVSAQ